MIRRRALPAFSVSVVVLVSVLAAGCEGAEPPSEPLGPSSAPANDREIARPRLELSGCRHRVGSACHLPADSGAQLHAWIDLRSGARLQLEIDGEPHVIDSTPVDGGQRLRIPIAPDARRIVIEGIEPRWAATHVLDIVREPVPAALVEAQQRIDVDDLEGALALLRGALDRPDPPGGLRGRERLEALQLIRRVLGVGDPEALQRSEEAAELAAKLGRPRDFMDAAASSAFIYFDVYADLAKAHAWTLRLEAELESASAPDEGRVWAGYYRGLLAARSGDLTTSLRAFDEARRAAKRLAMDDELLAISEVLGPALAELGRGDEALAVVGDTLTLARSPDWPCERRARSLNNIAWANLLLAQAGLEHVPAQPLLDEALAAVAETGACPTPDTAAFVRVNAALAALAEHEPEEAASFLAELHEHELPIYLEPWVDEIAAQVGLATGRWSLVPALVQAPDPGGSEPGLRFSALVRHAHTLERFGFVGAAIDSHAAAEAILEASVSTLGIELGRELYLAGRSASAVGLVELLIRDGQVDEALCRARLARGRALQSLDRAARIASLSDRDLDRREQLSFDYLQRREQLASEALDDWSYSASERDNRESRRRERLAEAELLLDEALRLVGGRQAPRTCSELPPLADDEVALVHFPARAGSWLFVVSHEQIRVSMIPAAQPELGIEAALADAREPLRAATRIRVLPTGAAWSIPFHALRFDSGVLLDAAPLIYSLDLPRRPRANPSTDADAESTALVIANPSDDLPFARREAERVSERLHQGGWTLLRREGADATRAALAHLVGQAALLHYAGHGTHAGTSGWDAALILHDGEVLGVSDILAWSRVPAGVVLTGCDTATVATDTLEGGMNLGRAFVLAGADWVIAAEGKVDDALALQIGEALYQHDADPRALDGGQALRRAQLELRPEHPEGWQAFRVIGP